MFDTRRALVAAGLALALMAANQAPFDGEMVNWLASDPNMTASGSDDMTGLEAPVLAEDPEITRQAQLEPPAISVWGDDTGSLDSLVSEARWHATSADMDKQTECLALSVYWEAKGEPVEGQLAVAQVILNRVERGRFGDSICAVVKAPRQFSFVRGGQIARPIDGKAWAEARAIAWIALADAWKPVVGEATHFHAARVNPGWRMQKVAQIGNHIFYR